MTCHDAAHRAACVQTFDVTELMQHLEVVNFNGRAGFALLNNVIHVDESKGALAMRMNGGNEDEDQGADDERGGAVPSWHGWTFRLGFAEPLRR